MIYGLLPSPCVSVLFARSDSCYFDLVGDVWDEQRDARNYAGSNPVVCHPPCRAWGRLRHWAKPRHDEKALAFFAVDTIRRVGGVLEHPHASTLWPAAQLPRPGEVDAWGGYTILVDQGWFGHAAPKPTWLYICGVSRKNLPHIPVQLHRAAGRTLQLSPSERERTPLDFAKFLLLIAGMAVTPIQVQPNTVTSAGVVTSTWQDSGTDLYPLLSISTELVSGPQKDTPSILEAQSCLPIKQIRLLPPAAGGVTPTGRKSKRRASYIDLDNCLIG